MSNHPYPPYYYNNRCNYPNNHRHPPAPAPQHHPPEHEDPYPSLSPRDDIRMLKHALRQSQQESLDMRKEVQKKEVELKKVQEKAQEKIDGWANTGLSKDFKYKKAQEETRELKLKLQNKELELKNAKNEVNYEKLKVDRGDATIDILKKESQLKIRVLEEKLRGKDQTLKEAQDETRKQKEKVQQKEQHLKAKEHELQNVKLHLEEAQWDLHNRRSRGPHVSAINGEEMLRRIKERKRRGLEIRSVHFNGNWNGHRTRDGHGSRDGPWGVRHWS